MEKQKCLFGLLILREPQWRLLFCLVVYFDSRPVFPHLADRSGKWVAQRGGGGKDPSPAAVHAAKLFVSFSHFHIAFSAHLFFLSTVAADFLGDSVVAWLINLRLISFDFRLSIGWNKDSFSYSLDPPPQLPRIIFLSWLDFGKELVAAQIKVGRRMTQNKY